jgi:hypothetical protein
LFAGICDDNFVLLTGGQKASLLARAIRVEATLCNFKVTQQ